MTQNKPLFDIQLSDAQLQRIEAIGPITKLAVTPTTECCPPTTECEDSAGCCPTAPKDSADSSSDRSTDRSGDATKEPCCGPRVMPPQNYITVATRKTDGVSYVDHLLSPKDHFGTIKARLGKSRMSYAVEPGLYAIGTPDEHCHVLVTANYKMTFDHLRSKLAGRNAWILVLNTHGINVWCAAGKGSFGTSELVSKIEETALSTKVSHRKIILPQLGAPGVSGHKVKEQTGFTVVWGPINAQDTGQFIDNNLHASNQMRKKTFPLKERAVLIPIDLRHVLKAALISVAIASPLAALMIPGEYLRTVVHLGVLFSLYLFTGVFAGAVLTPILLPYLPGRAFSVKSIWPAGALLFLLSWWLRTDYYLFELGGLSLIAAGLAGYCAMNFTGSSTYTSVSGVKKEMRIAIPLEIGAVAVGIAMWITANAIA